jgi:hypothetical protein
LGVAYLELERVMMERGEASVQKYILATRQFRKKAWIKDYWYCEAPKKDAFQPYTYNTKTSVL